MFSNYLILGVRARNIGLGCPKRYRLIVADAVQGFSGRMGGGEE